MINSTKRNFETLKDYNRFEPNLRQSLVKEVFPEHFTDLYPNLIAFLEGYYEFLDSDDNFGGAVNELLTIRDIEDTNLSRLNFIFGEIALGVGAGQFTFPREAIKNFGNFFRVKGSLYSAQGFFRAFFDENVEIIYPKDRLALIGSTPIGPDHDYLIQDGAVHQVFSILIKSPLAFNTWASLYRKFVHPSGYYLSSEVEIVGDVKVEIGTAASFFDTPNFTVISQNAGLNIYPEGEVTHIITRRSNSLDSAYAQGYPILYTRMNPYDTWSNIYSSTGNALSMAQLASYAGNFVELGGYNVSFDESANDSASSIKFDNTNATVDLRVNIYYNNLFVSRGYVRNGYSFS